MKEFKEWLADPSRVFNTLSVFLCGGIAGFLVRGCT